MSNKKFFLFFIAVIFMAAAISLGVKAWTEPTKLPPGGNLNAPINTSNFGQYKVGGLILNTGGATNGLIVQNGNVGIGTTTPSQKLAVAGILDMSLNKIVNLAAPKVFSDAATKGYVDAHVGALGDNTYYQLYITDSRYNGNLGGRSGADSKCNTDARKPSSCISNGYAFISVNASDEIVDLPATKNLKQSKILAWRNGSNQAPLAQWFGDSLDGSVIHSAAAAGWDSVDAKVGDNNTFYWTGSDSGGRQFSEINPHLSRHNLSIDYTCKGWWFDRPFPDMTGVVVTEEALGQTGSTRTNDGRWLAAGVIKSCATRLPLLCYCEGTN